MQKLKTWLVNGQLSFFSVSTLQLKTVNFYGIHARNGTTFKVFENLKTISTVHVANDLRERGIKILQNYKTI